MYLGENLIFLISQARAGSTMLQRILGGHPELHTVSESWLMLQPLLALRQNGPGAGDFHMNLARQALRDFLQALPDGNGDYFESVRRMYGYLYEKSLAAAGKRYFVDKTPLYSLVILELAQVFPRSKFIILFRNPLAVLASMIDTWICGTWQWFVYCKEDLFDAPRLLLQGKTSLHERALVVTYEELVREPNAVLSEISDWLGIGFLPEMVEYGRGALPVFRMGDPSRVYQHSRPSTEYVDAWQGRLNDPQIWRLASEYLEHLGADVLGPMGYPYADLRRTLDARRPSRLQLFQTLSLETLLSGRPGLFGRLLLQATRLRRAIRSRGVGGTAVEAARRLGRAVAGREKQP